MPLYSDTYWQPDGAPAALAPARVYQRFTTTLASLFSDPALTIPAANPAATSAGGVLSFYAASGDYWIHVRGLTFDVVIGDDFSWHAAYPHVQLVPMAIWTVTHNLNTSAPVVTTVDGVGGSLFGSVQFLDPNTVEIDFGVPTTGTAYIRR